LLIFGASHYLPGAEVLVVGCALCLYTKRPGRNLAKEYFTCNWLYLTPFVALLLFMLAQAIVLPPLNHDCLTYNLARTSLMLVEDRLFIDSYTCMRQLMYNMGFDVLNILFTRFRSDYFLGFINFILFLVVLAAVVSILEQLKVKTFYWIVSIAILFTNDSLILQATSSKNDIVLVACAMTAIATMIALRNGAVESPYGTSLLVLCLTFGFASKLYFAIFVGPLILLACIFAKMFRFQSNKITRSEWVCSACVMAFSGALMLLLFAFFYNNFLVFGDIFGDPAFVARQKNHDGYFGMAANATRYILTLFAVDSIPMKEWIVSFHDAVLKLGLAGTSLPFADHYDMTLVNHEDLVGVGFFFSAALCLAPVLFFLVKGTVERLLVALSILLFFIICYTLEWNPWWARFFPMVLVPISPLFAVLAQRYNLKYSVVLVVIVSFLCAVSAFSDNKTKSFRHVLLAMRNRDLFYNIWNYYVFGNADLFRQLSGSVLILADENDPIYQYYVLAKNAQFHVLHAGKYCEDGSVQRLKDRIAETNAEFVLDVGDTCPGLKLPNLVFASKNTVSSVRLFKVDQ
jgi:hypothetical protein